MPAGTDDDLLATRSTHFNSSQGYATTALIIARDDRLELIDTISTFDDRTCAYARTQRLGIRQGTETPFSSIVAIVTELTTASGANCNGTDTPVSRTQTITVIYHWDAAVQRYSPDSDAFEVLARENEDRF